MAMNSNIVIDIKQYPGAAMYAKMHNISFKTLFPYRRFLKKFQDTEHVHPESALQLPPHLEKLGGCLAGVEDSEDDKLNYLLEKYK